MSTFLHQAPGLDVVHERLRLEIDGTQVDLALFRRAGKYTPILFLHGWGSSKEDYVDVRLYSAFDGHSFLAYDAPGCGETWCADLSKVNIAFLVETAKAILHHFQISEFHVVGHSMGGLTALELAHSNPMSIRSFVNIKGNLASEDCFISRQIFDWEGENMDEFLNGFMLGCRQSSFFSMALYASSIRQRVQLGAIRGIFESMVQLSDNGDLLTKFLSFSFPRAFMFGEQHANLSYLSELKATGVELMEIPKSGHFPMYSNPVAMWLAIQDFIYRAESRDLSPIRQ
ncbi:uncharacterized protein TRIVIDRAFT_28886 [Trichoderma virens Gv29-8]|uniref:AB hydrolase-1 domain-containing protein n=1 Tax=Hypocrea virens (strain Gv29-8 / FGSC 10586) TaxID=413071 RepID=G9MTF0_HYPVG|nr:uncharacterized protein TRIVIDRAFT_28886 [Trichoderma virens Gv29-8]EHK23138.1 hypothetical protein TRIVIDRAFT_28886 [Trichoderma virens Gv29-8]UKZ48196.1 hypothetical protein TrVGV298_002432 [Trichoderma virens]